MEKTISQLGTTSILLVCGLGCSVFGVRTAEEAPYTVIEEAGTIEVREYLPMITAESSVAADPKTAQRVLFRRLAKYIFGKNKTQEDIAMTAPVVLNSIAAKDGTPMPIATTTTASDTDKTLWTMSFTMPAQYTLQTLPEPLTEDVALKQHSHRLVAVVRYSGPFGQTQARRAAEDTLLEWLKGKPGLEMVSGPVYAGYDPPFTMPWFRRNEVMVEVKRNSL